MKVQKAFTIDGKVVNQVFQKGEITVYEYQPDSSVAILYFVNNKTEFVIFKQDIEADEIYNINFLGVN